MPPDPHGKDKAATCSMPQKHDCRKDKVRTALIPRKQVGPSHELRRHPPPKSGIRETASITGSSGGETPEKHRAEQEIAGTAGSIGGASRKHRAQEKVAAGEKVGAVSMPPKNLTNKKNTRRPSHLQRYPLRTHAGVNRTKAEESEKKKHTRSNNSTKNNCKYSSAADKTVRVAESDIVQEVNDAIRRLNELGLGEDISYEEFCEYRLRLPPYPHDDNDGTRCSDEERCQQNFRHAEYRIRAYKLLHKVFNSELQYADLEENYLVDLLCKEEFSPDFLVQNNYFKRFEKEGVLDWFFHPDLCKLALDDYQRLVPRNHGGHEYAFWDEYYMYFHSYEMQQEYIEYFERLVTELQWVEQCFPIKLSSPFGERISSRGICQAAKIATGFSKITLKLVHIGFYECLNYIGFDSTWYKEYDSVYYEIWQRVIKEKKSFRAALEEVYKLNRFPLRHERMKYLLKGNCSSMESDFLTCTAGITLEDSEDKAKELIAAEVKKLRKKPKFYDQYIRTKIRIARAIEVI